MSQTYSTGELAKLSDVTVRTVQYYDKRGILQPSALSEGGRRIYTESDLEKLKVICFLRDMDFSIDQIKRLLAEDNAMAVLDILLTENIQELEQEITRKRKQLDTAVNLKKQVTKSSNPTFEHLSDLSLTMKNQKAWRRLQFQLFGGLTIVVLVFIAAMYYLNHFQHTGLLKFGVVLTITLYIVALQTLVAYYKKHIQYLCPNCHQIFEPGMKEFMISFHTPKTRKLTCPHCHQQSYCLELAKEK